MGGNSLSQVAPTSPHIMKQHFFYVASLIFGGITLLTGCNSKSEVENHQMELRTRDNRTATTFFADKTTDTVWVVSTESWKARVEMVKTTPENSNATTQSYLPDTPDAVSGATKPSLFTITPQEVEVKSGYFMTTPVVITATAPATQLLQHGYLRILPNGGPLNGLSHHIYQVGWLNISYPVVAKQENATSVMPNFSEVLPQKGGTTYLVFDLYDNQLSTHSLTSDADWLTVPEEAKQPAKGHHVVKLTFGENTSEKARTATFQLSSGGASTVITYVQSGRGK